MRLRAATTAPEQDSTEETAGGLPDAAESRRMDCDYRIVQGRQDQLRESLGFSSSAAAVMAPGVANR